MMDDEGRPERPVDHVVGMVLDALSIEELEARIVVLEGEIVRIREAIASKTATKSAADAIFKL